MATIREKKPGVWEIRVFTGRDDRGRPTQTSRTVRGGKRDAQRVAVELEGGTGRASAAGRTVRDVLDEWVEHNSATWAPSSARDQRSRVKAIKTDDTLGRMPVARLSVADIERWHARLRRAGKQDAGIKNLHGALRAALAQAQRWGWGQRRPGDSPDLRGRRHVFVVTDGRRVDPRPACDVCPFLGSRRIATMNAGRDPPFDPNEKGRSVMERAEQHVDDGGADRAAPLPLVTLIALVTAVTMELVRSGGPLLEYAFDVGIETVAAAAIATYLAPGIVVLAIGWGPRGSLASDRLLVGTILLAVIRLVAQGLTNHPRFFVGLVSIALSIAVLTQAVGTLAARREGGRSAGAAVALGAGFGVGLQLALGTWDAFWRESPVGWVVTATVVGGMVAAAVVVRRDPATQPVAPAGRVWVLGLTLSLLAMTLGNAAFASSQSDVRLAIAGPVAAVGLLVAGAAVSAGRLSPPPRAARSLLVVAPALTIGGIFWASGPVVLILLVAAQLAVVGALATALELAGETQIAGSSSLGSAAGSATVVGLGTIVPLLAFQIDYDLPLGFPNELFIVAAGLVVGVGAWFRGATVPAVGPAGAVIDRSVRMVLSVAAAMVLVGSAAVVGRAVTNDPRSAVTSAADQLTLVSWNVHYGVSPEASVDLQEIARSIEEHEPDIVTLQEVSRGWVLGGGADMATWLAERLDMDFVFAPAADRQFGNAILTDLPLENAVVVELPYGEGPQNRSAISADIRVGTATIRVSSVHLQNKDTTPTRLDQISTLLEAETGIAPHIIAGDFNAQPGWDEIERVLDAGYVSAQDVSGDPTALTDPSIDPEKRIDWVFGRGVTFIETEVLDEALSSDHLPLVVDFSAGG